jgi:hypothetical protein
MIPLTKLERKRAYDRRYRDEVVRVRCVVLEYPGCGDLDRMSLPEYHRHLPADYPEGTRVWINGVLIT